MCNKRYCLFCQAEYGDFPVKDHASRFCACNGFAILCWNLWNVYHNHILMGTGTMNISKKYYEDVRRGGLQMCFYCWREWTVKENV